MISICAECAHLCRNEPHALHLKRSLQDDVLEVGHDPSRVAAVPQIHSFSASHCPVLVPCSRHPGQIFQRSSRVFRLYLSAPARKLQQHPHPFKTQPHTYHHTQRISHHVPKSNHSLISRCFPFGAFQGRYLGPLPVSPLPQCDLV